MNNSLGLSIVAVLCFVWAACQHANSSRNPQATPVTSMPGAPSPVFPGASPNAFNLAPPVPVDRNAPASQPGSPFPQQPPGIGAPNSGAASVSPLQQSQSHWTPVPESIKLKPPVPDDGSPKQQPQSLEPPVNNKPGSPTDLPVGIAQFAQVSEQVSNGLRPSLDDGLDWLQSKGYRAVLFIHQPGEADGTDRKQVEKRGLKFMSLDVSPSTVSRKTVEEFKAIVTNPSNRPLFVYDKDGALAGGLWLLYFRLINGQETDAARVRAGSLGFREDRDPAHQAMWHAVQAVLATP
jgi:protein tyrosine phosphatase (PTP) superfamily phosphohydrolase (DUF442 family)